jgi:hypothetical protein
VIVDFSSSIVDLVQRGAALAVERGEIRQLAQRPEQPLKVGDEGHDDADLQVAAADLEAADDEDDGHADGGQQRHHAAEAEGDPLDRHLRLAVGGVEPREAVAVALFLAERADDLDAAECLLQVARHGADGVASAAEAGPGQAAPDGHGHEARREHPQRDQGELRVEHEHRHQRADEREQAAAHAHEGTGDEVLELLDVVGDARDEVARPAPAARSRPGRRSAPSPSANRAPLPPRARPAPRRAPRCRP